MSNKIIKTIVLPAVFNLSVLCFCMSYMIWVTEKRLENFRLESNQIGDKIYEYIDQKDRIPKKIVVSEITLVNPYDEIVGKIGVNSSGNSYISLNSINRENCVVVETTRDGGSIELSDINGNVRVSVSGSLDNGRFVMVDKEGNITYSKE